MENWIVSVILFSFLSWIHIDVAMVVGLGGPAQWSVSPTTRWIAMKFVADIYGS